MPLKLEATNKYVAYCDILGMSNKILNSFDEAMEIYNELHTSVMEYLKFEGVQVSMYSDSILVVGDDLYNVLETVQLMQFITLGHNVLIRGGVAFGKHWELKDNGNLFVVSEPLTKAARLESQVKRPCVVIDPEIISEKLWISRFAHGLFQTPILFFDNLSIVNPFSMYWFNSAIMRLSQMREDHPEHTAKFDWFESLWHAVSNNELLVPESVFHSFIEREIVVLTPSE